MRGTSTRLHLALIYVMLLFGFQVWGSAPHLPCEPCRLQVRPDSLGLGPKPDQDAQVAGLKGKAAGGGGGEHVPDELDGEPEPQAHDPVHVNVPQQQGQLLRIPARHAQIDVVSAFVSFESSVKAEFSVECSDIRISKSYRASGHISWSGL